MAGGTFSGLFIIDGMAIGLANVRHPSGKACPRVPLRHEQGDCQSDPEPLDVRAFSLVSGFLYVCYRPEAGGCRTGDISEWRIAGYRGEAKSDHSSAITDA